MYSISFDQKVYSDAALTTEASGPFSVDSTTQLPKGIYFSNAEYKGTGKNSAGTTLWTVRFTYPGNVTYIINGSLDKELTNQIDINSGAVYDE